MIMFQGTELHQLQTQLVQNRCVRQNRARCFRREAVKPDVEESEM